MKKIIIFVLLILVLGGTYFWFTQNQTQDQLATINTFVANTPAIEQKSYTSAEVAMHNSTSDCWVIISGKVVNVTTFTSIHPGGAEKITRVCGTDITERYKRESAHAQAISDTVVDKLTIGTLAQ